MFLWLRLLKLWKDAMPHHLEDTMEHSGHMLKFGKVAFCWPTMYEDTKNFVRICHRCQKHGNINSRNEMPLTNNLQVELFDVWGIDFMGLFHMCGGINPYTLTARLQPGSLAHYETSSRLDPIARSFAQGNKTWRSSRILVG